MGDSSFLVKPRHNIALTCRPFSCEDKMAAEDQKKALLEDLSDVVGQVRNGVVCMQ